MAEYGDYYLDEEGYMDDEGEMESIDWERYRLEMAAQQRAYEVLQRTKRPTFDQLTDRCIRPLLVGDTSIKLAELFGFCLLVSFTSCLPFLPKSSVPLTSLFLGLIVAFHWLESLIMYIILLCIIGYLVLFFGINFTGLLKNHIGILITLVGVGYTIFIQIFLLNAVDMTKVRGALMIMVMKLISLGFDIEWSVVEGVPNVLDYICYMFSVNTVTMGPWISYRQHKTVMEQKNAKKLLTPILKGVLAVVLCYLTLFYSTCMLDWLILDGYAYYSNWIIAFRDAQSFRFSHYFVCFASQASLYLSGYYSNGNNVAVVNRDDRQPSDSDLIVTKPLNIELPRSLVEVVVSWNLSMHNWLKTYAFRSSLRFGKFAAVLCTYAASSLLHGFNFQLSAVLFSLGFYTYAEHVLREKLSRSFNACIRARKCKSDCQHQYRNRHPLVLLVNIFFFALSIFHLAYLGMVFDYSADQDKGYSMKHTLKKWGEFGYISHYVGLGTLIFAKII